MRRALLLLIVLLLSACAVGPASHKATSGTVRGEPRSRAAGLVAQSAAWHLKHRPRLARRDCSGFVEAVLDRAGVPGRGSTENFWEDAVRDGRVVDRGAPGDLVFFDHTYDANRNGKRDDTLTHIGIVIAALPNETLIVADQQRGKLRTLRMNLKHPGTRQIKSEIVNDYLATKRYARNGGARLTGQLFKGFARPASPDGV